MTATIISLPQSPTSAFAAMANASDFNRAPCYGCGRSRLGCWLDPCQALSALMQADPRKPDKSTQVQRWCAEGGFQLHRDHHDNLYARPWFNVDDGAHYAFNGDAYPVTVIDVSKSGTRVTVRRDRTTRHGLFLIDPGGRTMVFTRRQDGSYRSSKCGTWTLSLGRIAERNREI